MPSTLEIFANLERATILSLDPTIMGDLHTFEATTTVGFELAIGLWLLKTIVTLGPAAILEKLLMQPIETVINVIQTQSEGGKSNKPIVQEVHDAVLETYNEGGVTGFYPALGDNLYGAFKQRIAFVGGFHLSMDTFAFVAPSIPKYVAVGVSSIVCAGTDTWAMYRPEFRRSKQVLIRNLRKRAVTDEEIGVIADKIAHISWASNRAEIAVPAVGFRNICANPLTMSARETSRAGYLMLGLDPAAADVASAATAPIISGGPASWADNVKTGYINKGLIRRVRDLKPPTIREVAGKTMFNPAVFATRVPRNMLGYVAFFGMSYFFKKQYEAHVEPKLEFTEGGAMVSCKL